jgi:hypothetical protein
MKVYDCPAALPIPEVDYRNYDHGRETAREQEHQTKLKEWLLNNGYKGKHTGKTVRFPVADGYALYMLADGKRSCLIHLAYGDGYTYRDVAFLPKKEILNRVDQDKRFAELFAGRKDLGVT